MKTIIAIVALCLLTATTFAQKGKTQTQAPGQQNAVYMDYTEAGNDNVNVMMRDVVTGIVWNISSGGYHNILKKGRYIIWLEMQNNSTTEEHSYWLDWGNLNQGIGLTLQPGDLRGVGTAPINYWDPNDPTAIELEQGAIFKLTRR